MQLHNDVIAFALNDNCRVVLTNVINHEHCFNEVELRKTTDLDRNNFFKLDEMKRYTEELLKTINMRGKK